MSRSVTVVTILLVPCLSQSVEANDPPVGSVVAWLKSYDNAPALPPGWVECNGQVLNQPASPFNGQTIPDLNGQAGARRFLRGSTSSGSVGGAESHQHSIPTPFYVDDGGQRFVVCHSSEVWPPDGHSRGDPGALVGRRDGAGCDRARARGAFERKPEGTDGV